MAVEFVMLLQLLILSYQLQCLFMAARQKQKTFQELKLR